MDLQLSIIVLVSNVLEVFKETLVI